jgi:hypothetical protein
VSIFQYDLINKKKQEKKKGHYANSGQIVVKSVNIEQVLAGFSNYGGNFHVTKRNLFYFASRIFPSTKH